MTIHYQNRVFPNDMVLCQLMEKALASKRDAIVDVPRGITASYAQLLTDVLRTREEIWAKAPRSMFDDKGIITLDSPFIFNLSSTSYLVPVAAFAILSIGAAISPLSPNIKEEEALRSLQKANSSIIIADPIHMTHALGIQDYAASQGRNIIIVPISCQSPSPPTVSELNIRIDPDWQLDPDRPGLLMMTSGTTGPSKGVIHARKLFAISSAELTTEDTYLCHRSAAWMGGLLPLTAGLCRGTKLDIVKRDSCQIWERLRHGGITILRSAPAVWLNLMEYYQEVICKLAPEIIEKYTCGVRSLRSASTGAGYLLPHVRRFWVDEMGLRMLAAYAGTEMGGPVTIRRSLDFSDDEQRRIGTPFPNVTVKLSQGDQGEILVKSPFMFLRYLDNPEATKAAFDEDGFYKTGDLARWEKDEYILMGRISEFVRYNGHKVPMHDVEAYIWKLPYIAEVCALAVPVSNSAFTSERVGVLIRLKARDGQVHGHCREHNFTLEKLREDLSSELPFPMLPTAMHVLQEGEAIPKTISDKVIRKEAVRKFFPDEECSPQAKIWDAEVCLS
ncbi:hypothetical protein N7451_011692 [Penicillium sp. IBT 35674x]|nr:hypothetical protein N7451_011692 [Penicillium sp. IBT 35674x]